MERVAQAGETSFAPAAFSIVERMGMHPPSPPRMMARIRIDFAPLLFLVFSRAYQSQAYQATLRAQATISSKD